MYVRFEMNLFFNTLIFCHVTKSAAMQIKIVWIQRMVRIVEIGISVSRMSTNHQKVSSIKDIEMIEKKFQISFLEHENGMNLIRQNA